MRINNVILGQNDQSRHRATSICIEFDQNFKFFDRPKTGALYFCHMVIGSEQNERVGYEDMSERPGRDLRNLCIFLAKETTFSKMITGDPSNPYWCKHIKSN